MRNFLRLLAFLILFSTLVYNCSNTDESSENTNESSKITDDRSYLVMKWDGALFEIGNNTSAISPYGTIDGISSSTSIIFNAIVTTPNSIYIIDRKFSSGDSSIIIYDRKANTSTKTVLDLSNPSFGSFPVIVSLDWDENSDKLIGIVASNAGYPESVSNIIQIDPLNLKVTNLEIELGQKNIISTTLSNSKLFASSVKNITFQFDDLLQIDLKDKTYKSLNFNLKNGITKLSSNRLNNLLFCYSLGATNTNPNPDLPILGNRVEPFILNIANGEYNKILPDTDTGTLNFNSKSYYDETSNNYVSLMFTRDFTGIMEYNNPINKITYINGSNWEELNGGRNCILSSIQK